MGVVGRTERRLRRKKRVRKKIKGSPEKPRLCVFRSARHIYAQLIDDSTGRTQAEVSSLSKDLSQRIRVKGGNKEAAVIVGTAIAERAFKNGIKKVVFDRGRFLYRGRVKGLAEGARKGGLEF